MSTLTIIGICLVVLGIGGRVAIGRGDAVRRSSPRSGGSSKGKKSVANAGTGAGIIAIIASLLFGGGAGLGLGTGTGVGTGSASTGQAVESAVSDEEETATLEDAEKAAQDSSTITIRINKTDIYINDYKCEDVEAFGQAVEDMYEDGMNVTVVDDYADNETYSEVTGYLKDNAYEYLVEAK